MRHICTWIKIIMQCLLLGVVLTSCHSRSESDELFHFAQDHTNDLRLSTYITVNAVTDCLKTEQDRQGAVALLKSLGITKAYIETYRSGNIADPELLRSIIDHFQANNLETTGGIATTPGKDFGIRQEGQLAWFNFQHPKTQSELEKVVRLTAREFDEMIIDDFLCSADTSEISNNARGARSWSQYRRDLMTELSERVFIKPAREENPNITIIIKYPQWYDRFHMFGYDVPRESNLYDKVWIGTETRGPETQRMGYVQQYEGYVNFRWISSFTPGKIGGAWFDHIDCDQYDFIDQAYQTVLAGAREIILFNYFDLKKGHPGHQTLRTQLTMLVELAKMVKREAASGIYGYKPPNSDAENDHYIFDYMGMIGIPLIPVSEFPQDAQVVFLATQATKDTQIVERIEQLVSQGKRVILTAGFLASIPGNQQLEELSGVRISTKVKALKVTDLFLSNEIFTFDKDFTLATKLVSTTAETMLKVKSANEILPFMTLQKHSSGGRVYILNMDTFSEKDFKAIREVLLAPKSVSWLDLPDEWLNTIRRSFTEPLGWSFKGPGRIGVYSFSNDNWVFYNFNNKAIEIDFKIDTLNQAVSQLRFKNRVTGMQITPVDDQLHIAMTKRNMLWLTTE